ncbi:hypothetical protein, partial [Enterococcus faecium]|uniref:hypothetical protein n=1 Tax=Enterococcus faecium TaxID=1352 RepID=UPI001EE84CF0
LWLKTLYRKRAVTWPFIFYTIIWTLSHVMKEYADFFVWLIIQNSFFIKIWINFEIIDLKGIQKSG